MFLSKSKKKTSIKREREASRKREKTVVEQMLSLPKHLRSILASEKLAIQILAIILVRKNYSGMFENSSFKYYRKIQREHFGG